MWHLKCGLVLLGVLAWVFVIDERTPHSRVREERANQEAIMRLLDELVQLGR